MKKTYQIPDLLPDNLNTESWLEFVQNRIDLGKPLTPLAGTKAINKLIKYSKAVQQAAIDNSIEGGWSGLFPESVRVEQVTEGFIAKHTDTSWADELPPTNVRGIRG